MPDHRFGSGAKELLRDRDQSSKCQIAGDNSDDYAASAGT